MADAAKLGEKWTVGDGSISPVTANVHSSSLDARRATVVCWGGGGVDVLLLGSVQAGRVDTILCI